MTPTLIYVHDPMCSWCWGFKSSLETLTNHLTDKIKFQYLLGGLAVDSDEPMPDAMQQGLQQTWKQIQSVVPGTQFNFDFWTKNQPRRSTWPSCRAVIAAREQSASFERPMISAIQNAYYLQALNPSNTDTLTDLAVSIGCDADLFAKSLHSDSTRTLLLQEINLARQLGVQGFPSLVLRRSDNHVVSVAIDYNNHQTMLDRIEQLNVA